MTYQPHLANPENFIAFRDAVSNALIEKISSPPQSTSSKKSKAKSKSNSSRRKPSSTTATAKSATKPPMADEDAQETTAEDLTDFTEYIALLAFTNLPADLQSLTHRLWTTTTHDETAHNTPFLSQKYPPLPLTSFDIADIILPSPDPTLEESLTAYSILTPPSSDLYTFLAPVMTSYISTITAPPPPPSSTRTNACEICGRDWIPLTYHHLIPKMVHAKAVKRGWHREEDLNNVAWLCRACHSFVHRFKGHEELAREYFTVESLLGAEAVSRFAGWVGRVRWKAR